eukprot:scaffold119461_cov82-Phaeocystis_antarctica.AAC.6
MALALYACRPLSTIDPAVWPVAHHAQTRSQRRARHVMFCVLKSVERRNSRLRGTDESGDAAPLSEATADLS